MDLFWVAAQVKTIHHLLVFDAGALNPDPGWTKLNLSEIRLLPRWSFIVLAHSTLARLARFKYRQVPTAIHPDNIYFLDLG